MLDGAQAAGNIDIDVREIGCSFYLLSCHKWLCGPEGVAAVYIREDRIREARVPSGEVGMQDSFDIAEHTIQMKPDAGRFEYGGRHTPMYAGFRNPSALPGTSARSASGGARGSFTATAGRCSRSGALAEILSPEDERLRTAIFAFLIPGADHRELVRRAWEDCGIIIQWRTVDLVTGKEGVRVSLNWFIREEEIDRLAEEIVTLTGEGL